MNVHSDASTPKMREQVIDFLRCEIVGPDPQAARVQDNGEEILINETPRHRYAAGVLFPQKAVVEKVESLLESESENLDDESEISNSIVENRFDDSTRWGKPEDEEAETGVDLSNATQPAALGFSCLCELPQKALIARARAATYQPRYERHPETNRAQTLHERKPFESEVIIGREALEPTRVQSTPFPVAREGVDESGLELRVLARPFRDENGENNLRLLTITLINTHEMIERVLNEHCFFQVELELEDAGGAAIFCEYPDASLVPDEEEQSLALLYRHRKTFGVGHGCAVNWPQVEGANRAKKLWSESFPVHEIKPILPTSLNIELSMRAFSDRGDETQIFPTLEKLCAEYSSWIEKQHAQIENEIPEVHRKAARRHLENCRTCLARMRDGVELLRDDPTVLRAFRLANRAMLSQQLHYELGTKQEFARAWQKRDGVLSIAPYAKPDEENPPAKKGVWRPFQLAFLLMNLRGLAQPEDASRGMVDLIWFPTGGGKTEAYLGLAAYTIILRRLLNADDGGTAVLMRYTLRLLTAQQFQRAASLICALELLRRNGDIAGETPISIGLWAGSALTPNKREDAKREFEKFQSEGRKNPFVLLNCPWCGAPMGAVKPEIIAPDGSKETAHEHHVVGYKTDFFNTTRSGPKTIIFQCRDESCEFFKPHCLPVCVIDEDLFAAPPTLLLGTVDKFAMLAWRPEARAFFGRGDKAESTHAPPCLIIQDELHLISGALGSTVGHYETVIQELCSRAGSTPNARIGPKIVASTATVSRAKEQCHALWNCGEKNVFQFPPQCLKAGDSFFAREDENAPGRKYVGVFAQAATSPLSALVRVFASLLQAPRMAEVHDEKERDPYWTLVGYFNSLRELGHTATLVRAEVSEHLERIHRRLGLHSDPALYEKRRWARTCMELTSRIASDKITESLQRLFLSFPQAEGRDFPEDVCLATNMISVGVDVPRLGVMAVSGQPKTSAEYIQATSRVGREHPGLVVMIYNEKRARDRSHFEHFHSYHGAIYKYVEPTSVTPFSSPVRERALHSLLTIWMRMNGGAQLRKEPRLLPDPQSQSEFETLRCEIENIIARRVEGVDEAETEATMKELNELIARWKNISANRYGKPDYDSDDSAPLLYRAGLPLNPDWHGASWPTMTSMRGVDATCNVGVLGVYPQTPDTNDEENLEQENTEGADDVSS